ncbi:MAG TPA: helix-turn-helix domain-containing protein [Acidothermaceae bacterium]
MLPRDYAAENCSIARTLEVVGDRWTLLIVREALAGVTRFDVFLERLGVARNVLADRLARLVEEGILDRCAYQQRPVRCDYVVTEKGHDLWPVLASLMAWGDRYTAPNGAPRVLTHAGCGGRAHQVVMCASCGWELASGELITRPGPGGRRRRPARIGSST